MLLTFSYANPSSSITMRTFFGFGPLAASCQNVVACLLRGFEGAPDHTMIVKGDGLDVRHFVLSWVTMI